MGVSDPTQGAMAQLPGCVMSVVFSGVALRDIRPVKELPSGGPVHPIGSEGC